MAASRIFSPLARAAASFALAALVLAGCDALGGPDYEEQTVVSAALEVGAPLAMVQLSRTAPLGEPVDRAALAVGNAEVRVDLLGPDGAVEAAYPYQSFGDGRYAASGDTDSVSVLPNRTYALTVTLASGEVLTARTRTPEALEVVQQPAAEVAYLSGFGPELRVRSTSSAERQSVYLIEVKAEAIDEYEVYQRDDETFGLRRLFVDGLFGPTPDAASFIDGIDCEPAAGGEFDCDFLPSDLSSGSSPLLNEQTYVDNGDGTVTVRVPWIAVSFYGPHTFRLNSLDDALVAFVSTQAVQFNPTTLSPGEIPNVTSNVEGGLGVFGSFARAAASSTIVPREGV